MNKILVAVLLGLVLGVLGARYLIVGSWLNLVPWGIAGLAIGAWGTKNESIVNGMCYGFILTFAFMIAGYSGTYSLISRFPFFAVLGVFGGVCGLMLGLLGYQVKAKIAEGKRH